MILVLCHIFDVQTTFVDLAHDLLLLVGHAFILFADFGGALEIFFLEEHQLLQQLLFFTCPGLLELMLKMELSQNFLHQLWREHRVWKGESCIMPSNDHFGDFSTREALRLRCYVLNYVFIDPFHSDQLFAVIDASWVLPEELSLLHGS
jgi:hypothetical protein